MGKAALAAVGRADFPAHEENPAVGASRSLIEPLFRIFVDMERRADQGDDKEAESLIDSQTAVIELAVSLPSRTVVDVLFKLALWRWDTPDLDPSGEGMQRNDQIAYSAFRDLVALTGEESALTIEDVEELLREREAASGDREG